jgi:hypothetical protein
MSDEKPTPAAAPAQATPAPALAPALAPAPATASATSACSSSSLTPLASASAPAPSADDDAPSPAEPRLSFIGLLGSLVRRYETFVAESGWYTGLLETAKTFSVFLPGRFSDSDLRGEFAYMGLCLLSFYHDGICARPRSHPSRLKLSGQPLLLTAREPPLVRALNAALFILSSSECLLELAAGQWYAARRGAAHADELRAAPGAFFQAPLITAYAARLQRFRMKAVLVIEALKAAARLLLLWRNRGKVLLPADPADVHTELQQRQAELAVAAHDKAEAARAMEKAAYFKTLLARRATELSSSAAAAAAKAKVAEQEEEEDQDVTDVSTPAAAAAAATAAAAAATSPTAITALAAGSTPAAPVPAPVSGVPVPASLQTVSAATGAAPAAEDPAAALAAASLRRLYTAHGRANLPHGQFAPAPMSAPPAAERAGRAAPPLQAASEALYWLRPVVYAALKVKFGSQSWTPLLASLAVDGLAYALAGRGGALSPAQRAAWTLRTRLYAYYLLRSPVFDSVTVVPLQILADVAAYIPIAGGFINAVIEVGFNLQQTHFYTSAS